MKHEHAAWHDQYSSRLLGNHRGLSTTRGVLPPLLDNAQKYVNSFPAVEHPQISTANRLGVKQDVSMPVTTSCVCHASPSESLVLHRGAPTRHAAVKLVVISVIGNDVTGQQWQREVESQSMSLVIPYRYFLPSLEADGM